MRLAGLQPISCKMQTTRLAAQATSERSEPNTGLICCAECVGIASDSLTVGQPSTQNSHPPAIPGRTGEFGRLEFRCCGRDRENGLIIAGDLRIWHKGSHICGWGTGRTDYRILCGQSVPISSETFAEHCTEVFEAKMRALQAETRKQRQGVVLHGAAGPRQACPQLRRRLAS